MRRLLEDIQALVGPGYRRRGFQLVLLALLVGIIEALGAVLVFQLLQAVSSPNEISGIALFSFLRFVLDINEKRELLIAAALLVGAFFVVRGVVFVAQRYAQNRVAQSMGLQLAVRLISGYLRLPYAFHLQRNSAELIRNTYTSATELVHNVLVPSISLVSEFILVAGITTALFFAAPVATAITAFFFGPLVYTLLRLVQPRMASLGKASQRALSESLQAMQESLRSIKDIKVLDRADYFVDRFARPRAELSRTTYLRATLSEIPRVTVETSLILVVVLLLLVYLLGDSPIESALPALGLIGYAGTRVMPSLNRLVASANSLRYASAATSDIRGDLDMFLSEERSDERAPDLNFKNSIHMKGVSYRFADSPSLALDGINLRIGRGEFVGIIGETGSGKSTLIDVLVGLLSPTEGQVLIDQVDLREITRSWQSKIGIVHQTPPLLDDTIRNNIAFGLGVADISEEDVQRAVERAQLTNFINQLPLGLDTIIGESGVRVSGGQRQRIAIARALYQDPEVLVMDEGTSALDNLTESRVLASLDLLRGEITVILVAHRLGTVMKCDTIFVLSEGRLIDSGRFEELAARNQLFEA